MTSSATERPRPGLKAWYRQLCKRPCFHDEYLQAFNEPGCHLVHTDGKGVEEIVARGVLRRRAHLRSRLHHLRVGIRGGDDLYAAGPASTSSGRDGVRLSEYWADGMKTMHGIHIHGFPNAFMVQLTQGANLISNVPHNFASPRVPSQRSSGARRDDGTEEVELSSDAEKKWVELLLSGPGMMLGDPDCTPGYYNNEGQPLGPTARFNVGYPFGAERVLQLPDGVA